MNCCVLVKISRRIVSFWYQTDDNRYAPLAVKDSNEVPLYFYVSGNDFIFGNGARDSFYANNPNAFGNYFELIKDPEKYFSIYGNKKHAKQLFYYGTEQYLSHFINTVLYKSDSIESYRPQFPLRFLFEADIEEKERLLIETIFTDAGYNNIESVDYNRCLFEALQKDYVIQKGQAVLLLTGIDNVLYLELYRHPAEKTSSCKKIAGHGADPRVKILAEMIVEYIITQQPYLSVNKETEIAGLLPFSAGLLESIAPVIKGHAILTDGKPYWFKVSEKNLNTRLLFDAGEDVVYTAIDDLLAFNNLNSGNTSLLLGSEEINTAYFLNKLLKKYPHVSGISTASHADAMKCVFAKIAAAGYQPAGKGRERPPEPGNITDQPPAPLLPASPGHKNHAPPVLPPQKAPPQLPEKKTQVVKPKLPEGKPGSSIHNKPVLPPPLPVKKKEN